MALSTSFTTLFSLRHPIALAPMGGSAGGALAAAVSNGGGLGLLGGGNGWDRDWLDRELAIVADSTDRPWGIGFQSWAVGVDTVQHALTHQPHAVMLSFGDPYSFVEPIRDGGARVIIQVTDLEEAKQAVEIGADVIVAQGTEAGGHGARRGRSTLPFVPAVVDLAGSIPVLAAGGIADGRGIAAALTLGAAGALLGTRFQATTETLIAPVIRQTLIDGRGDDIERSTVLDIARGSPVAVEIPCPHPGAQLPRQVARSRRRTRRRRRRQSGVSRRRRIRGSAPAARLGRRRSRPHHRRPVPHRARQRPHRPGRRRPHASAGPRRSNR